jgi:hypothetical protein
MSLSTCTFFILGQDLESTDLNQHWRKWAFQWIFWLFLSTYLMQIDGQLLN